MLSAVKDADERASAWLAATDHGPLRPALRAVARSADVLAPWVVASAPAVVVPGARRPTVRAWAAVAGATLVESALLKPIVQRDRPAARGFPRGERRRTDPSTSAFPSGHVGSGVAFAVAAWPESTSAARTYLAVVAVGVAYARVFTGRHFTSDAVAGAAVGAMAGLVARRALPPEDHRSEDDRSDDDSAD